ncbi:M56 family metallopeptidase [Natronospira bacteriovora]|uniref:Protein TonB n=1 Tax=Natronospira bacteriovora TaxID=3069753 RepID=A0ABU0WD16_9GAMM|nr:M56 family metallopeptidase [Natronospira sp. AB-CW4]MDQ2070815.1 M56 family metallopeptidase [Natronospira sp. AB-CW4]
MSPHAILHWLAHTSLALALLLPLAWLLSAWMRRCGAGRLAYACWLLPLPALLPAGLLATGAPLATPLPPSLNPTVVMDTLTVTGSETGSSLSGVLLAVWLAGALLLGGFSLFSQWRFERGLQQGARPGSAITGPWRRWLDCSAIPRWLSVMQTSACRSPMLVGVVRPRLVLPLDSRDRVADEGLLMLEHELAHLRHGDTVWNAVLLFLRSLFWFHPLVHLAAGRMRRDQELAADESVVVQLKPSTRIDYAHLLCSSSGLEPRHLAVSWITRGSLRERMMMIGKSREQRLSVAGGLGILLLALVSGTALAGSLVNTASDTDRHQATEADPAEHKDGALKPIVRVAPKWPREAVQQGIEGEVTMEMRVHKDGSVSDVTVVASNPEGVFDEAAVEAVEQWRIHPAMEELPDGSVEVRAATVRQTIHFRLD